MNNQLIPYSHILIHLLADLGDLDKEIKKEIPKAAEVVPEPKKEEVPPPAPAKTEPEKKEPEPEKKEPEKAEKKEEPKPAEEPKK